MTHLRLRYVLIGCLAILLTFGTGQVSAQSPTTDAKPQTVLGSCTLPNNSQFSLSQAQRLYASGCYSSAATVLNRISQQGNSLDRVVAFSNLSLTHQQLGNWEDATTALDTAFEHITSVVTNKQAPLQAQAFEVRGQLQVARGQSAAAADSWQQAAQLYTRLDQLDRAALSQIRQAKALRSLGLFQQVKTILMDVEYSLRNQPDSNTKAIALRQLADALWMTGNSEIPLINSTEGDKTATVEKLFERSKIIGQELDNPDITAAVSLSRGNFNRQQFLSEISKPEIDASDAAYQSLNKALNEYQKVATETDNRQLAVQASLNQFNLLVNRDFREWFAKTQYRTQDLEQRLKPEQLRALYDAIKTQLDSLPMGQQAVYARVNLAQSLMHLKEKEWDEKGQPSVVDWSDISTLLDRAEEQASQLNDRRTLSYVLGHRAKFYELTEQIKPATQVTQTALDLSQSVRAEDISYQWQAQLGHLLAKQDERENAIAAYTAAFETLQILRTDLITANIDQRFYFRDNIEPIYRELVALLMPATAPKNTSNGSKIKTSQKELDLARQVMDSLKVAELENFFQAACVNIKTELGDALKTGNAGIYPILLENRLEILLQLPTATDNDSIQTKADTEDSAVKYTLRRFSTEVKKEEIQNVIKEIQPHLDAYAAGAIGSLQSTSQKLYNYIFLAQEVGTSEQAVTLADALEIEMQDIDHPTLIFVLDGALRSIPMGILYDSKQQKYLLEKYAIALNLGIEVRESTPLPKGDALRVLAAGVKNPPKQLKFPALPNVPSELAEINNSAASVEVLQENTFTQNRFNQQLNNARYQIVHLATHGTFSSNRDETFIVAQDTKILVDQLSEMFRNTQAIQNPIEMIVFSACSTAEGDDRAVLGLAGATVQSGAHSAIAALWSVDDRASVTFARLLYRYLNDLGDDDPEIGRAVALQQAQLKMKELYESKNKYWAPYVLVGSWR